MALSHTVKFNEVNNLSDARYAAGMGVQYIGMSIDQLKLNDEDYMKLLEELCGWITGPELVLESKGLELQEVHSILDRLPFNALESSNLHLLNESGLLPIWIISWSETNKLEELISVAKAAVNESTPLLIHLTVQQSNLPACLVDISSAKLPKHWSIILKWDEGVQGLLECLSTPHVSGISITPGEEEKTGLKDFSAFSEIIELLEVED